MLGVIWFWFELLRRHEVRHLREHLRVLTRSLIIEKLVQVFLSELVYFCNIVLNFRHLLILPLFGTLRPIYRLRCIRIFNQLLIVRCHLTILFFQNGQIFFNLFEPSKLRRIGTVHQWDVIEGIALTLPQILLVELSVDRVLEKVSDLVWGMLLFFWKN